MNGMHRNDACLRKNTVLLYTNRKFICGRPASLIDLESTRIVPMAEAKLILLGSQCLAAITSADGGEHIGIHGVIEELAPAVGK